MEERLFWRPREVCRTTGICRSAVYAALHDGRLIGRRVGRSWLIEPRAVREWLEGEFARTEQSEGAR